MNGAPELASELERSLFDGLEGMCGLGGACTAGDGRWGGGLAGSLREKNTLIKKSSKSLTKHWTSQINRT